MNILVKSALACLTGLYGVSGLAQVKELPGFTKDGLIADYRLAIDILKAQHPDPYKFTDSVELTHKTDSLLKLAEAQTSAFATARFSPVQLIRDVHTSLKFSEDNNKDILGNINFFPFPVVIERDKMMVNIKGGEIPFAAEIIAIDGQPVKEVISSLRSSAYSDGFINTGTDRIYSSFQVIMSMRSPASKSYKISYLDAGTKKQKDIELPSLSSSAGYHAAKQAVLPVNQLARAYWIYGAYDDIRKTGTLTVNTFNLQEAYAYKEFSSFFKEVNKRRYKNVIIDVRSNGGGNPAISALLFSFLAKQSFENVYNYRTKNISIAYQQYAITDGQRHMSEEDIRNNLNFLYQRFDKDSASGFYVGNARLKEGQLENFPPDKDAFGGTVYVLTGGGTVSAATYFASLVQKNRRGLIVGKETGSGENATTAAWFINYLLPNTKSILTVPMSALYFFNSTSDNGLGVIPDRQLPIDRFISYMKATEDPEWSYTMDLIQK